MVKRPTNKSGFALVEMILYVTILAVVSIMVIEVLLMMTRAYGDFRVSRTLTTTAEIALERIVRESRSAKNIVDLDSSFGAHPGRLSLTVTDQLGNVNTREFYLADGILYLKEDSETPVSLLPPSIEVTNLVFKKITATNSEGVKVEITIQDQRVSPSKSLKFYTTVVLRGSY